MEFRKILTLGGPNIWANFPVLEAWVDLGGLKDSPSDSLPGFNERLTSWLPTMVEHRCSEGVRGGFFERLRRGTYQAHILEHVTLELQSLAGTPVGYGRARETSEEGVYKVAIEFEFERVARACLEVGRALCLAAVYDRPIDVAAEVDKLREMVRTSKLGPSTAAIVTAAQARSIPHERLNTGSLIQFGYGCKQRRIWTAETDRTSAIAQEIAQDKELTRTLLERIGAPTPAGRAVLNADDAWKAAEEIGAAVVVKPQFGNHGRGVSTNLTTREQVMSAYEHARTEGDEIIVERYAPGEDYRFLVIGGRLAAAARRDPAQVVGDGSSTIRELVDRVNADPRRGDGHESVLTKITLDAIAIEVLAEQNFTPDSIPPERCRVLIRRNANLSTGGTATDVTDEVHPEVAARAIEAARVVGLDIAGVDIIARDITRPLEEQEGAIVEVNAGPGLRMHLEPSLGSPRPVGEAIVDTLYPPGDDGRIPIAAVTGVNGKTTVTRLIAHILEVAGRKVGLTCTDGVFIDGRRIWSGDASGPISARMVLSNPSVQAAVLETARGGILRAGLGFDRCDVGVVTNIGEGDHLGLADVQTVEKLAQVKRCVVDVVAPHGAMVLNAEDPLVAAMPSQTKNNAPVIFFAKSEEHPVVAAHRARGGLAVFVRDNAVVLGSPDGETEVCPLSRVPLTYHGRIGFQVENVLAATAAAWALKLPLEDVRRGLAGFPCDVAHTPGRFNVMHHRGATVIADYGHNPSALLAIGAAISRFPHERRLTVFTVAGDRRDEDIIRQGEIIGNLFDDVILYEDQCRRGREDGVVTSFVRHGLARGTRVARIHETRGEFRAVELALKMLRPGDLLLVQADQVEECLEFIQGWISRHATPVLETVAGSNGDIDERALVAAAV